MNNKVLIIEDNTLLAGLFKNIFEKKNWEVCVEYNGTDGYEHIKKEEHEIVMLDIFMPGESGFSVLKKIQDNPDAKIKVAVVTSATDPEVRKKAKELGADKVLIKTDMRIPEIVKEVISLNGD